MTEQALMQVSTNKIVTRSEALKALDLIFDQAKDVPDMTLDEINAEIKEVRDVRKAKY